MSDEPNGTNGVRITNAQIYSLLQETNGRVNSVQQTVKEVLHPGLNTALARIDSLEKAKADREMVTEVKGRTTALEMRVYAIIGGLLAALGAGKGLGIL